MSIGVKLNQLRIKKGKSLQEVADAIGASKTHIWEMEKNRSSNPSLDMLTKLADYFGITIRSLIGEDLESADDEKLVLMFRQAAELDERDQDVLAAMIRELRNRNKGNETNN